MTESRDPPRLTFSDRAVFLPETATLVIADLHLGRGVTSNISFPIESFHDDTDRLSSLLSMHSPDTLVIAGDIIHSFTSVPTTVKEQLVDLEESIQTTGTELVYVRGNHDTILDHHTDIPVLDYFCPDSTDILIAHGHELPDSDASYYIIGHEHPAMQIEGNKYPCFLQGPADDSTTEVVIVPAFTDMAQGTTVNSTRKYTPTVPIVTEPGALHPIIYHTDNDELFRFPSLSTLKQMFTS